MRIIIQRVSEASVLINHKEKRSIQKGMLVLVGFEDKDNQEDIEWICKKILQLRIFEDDQGLMNVSIQDIQGELLIISQFTLFAKTKKGNRPSFIKAAKPEVSQNLYNLFLQHLEALYSGKIRQGEFGAHMDVNLTNDGPVSLFIDSKNKE